MSKADEMFEKLGYEKFYMKIKRGRKAGEYWGEKFVNQRYCIEICFDYMDKDLCIGTIGDAEAVYIGKSELQAIIEKTKELGWNE